MQKAFLSLGIVLVGFVLSPSMVFGASLYQQGDYTASQSLHNIPNNTRWGNHYQVLNGNATGMTGTSTSYSFYSNTTHWTSAFSDPNVGALLTISTCTVPWTQTASGISCTGSIATVKQAGYTGGGSIAVSSNIWTITYATALVLDSSKYYASTLQTDWYSNDFTFSLSGINTGTCLQSFYNYQSGAFKTTCNDGVKEDFWSLNGNGGYTPPVQTDGIKTTTSPTSQTYVNNPVTFSGTYNNGITGAYDTIQFDLTNTTNSFQLAITKPTTLISGTGIPYSFTQNLPLEGNYTYQVRLYDNTSATSTAWFVGNNFALGTTTATTTPIRNAPEISCSIGDLACYIKKAMVWLLYPSDSLKTSFDIFITEIQTKPPVGYFVILKNNLQGLTASSTPAVNIVIPNNIKTTIFNPFDTGIASIIWFFFAFNFYKRLKHIQL